jgi:tetratricopeptide (TPR) repeat protein
LARAQSSLGFVLKETGRPVEAEKAYGQARGHWEKLVAATQEARYRLGLAALLNGLGILLKDSGRYPEAEQAHREALRLCGEQGPAAQSDFAWQIEQASAHFQLAHVLAARGRFLDADKEGRLALTTYEKVTSHFPNLPEHAFAEANCRHALGKWAQ